MDRKRKPTWLAIERARVELGAELSIVNLVPLAILKIRIYVSDYVLCKVCDLTHQFQFR